MNSKKTNTNKETSGIEDRKVLFSTLWIFVMFNMLAADILSFMVPGFLAQLMTGYAEEIHITPGFLLVAAIMMEIPMAMIFLSRIMKYRANRWANIIAGVITIAFVIGGGSNKTLYIFFATIEVVSILLIVWFAWKWRNPEIAADTVKT